MIVYFLNNYINQIYSKVFFLNQNTKKIHVFDSQTTDFFSDARAQNLTQHFSIIDLSKVYPEISSLALWWMDYDHIYGVINKYHWEGTEGVHMTVYKCCN